MESPMIEKHDRQQDAIRNQFAMDAKNATDKEQSMTLMQGLRLYPKAIMWSVIISTCIAMEGYDLCLLGNFYGFPQFNERFGELVDGTYQVPARWQAGLSNAANCGEIIGLFINGLIAERLGYKNTVLVCLIAMAGLIFIPVFSNGSLVALLMYYLLAGIPWGIWQTLTITYASDVCPIALRGYLTTYVNFCWGIGQVIGVGVIKSQLNNTSEWAYRLPWALQWMWIVPLVTLVAMAPESPWLLVRKGKVVEARKNLLRLTSLNRETDFDVDETLAMMRHTTEIERQTTKGASYKQCFQGINRRRTEIVCMVWAIQNLAGNSFTGYSNYFLQQGGLPASSALSFVLGQYGINCIGVFGAWALMSWGFGRRSLYFYGQIGLCTMLVLMGCMYFVRADHPNAAALATGGLMLGWATVYQLTVGTICYSLVGEIPSRQLLVKTVALGRNAYNVVGIACSVFTPYMVNPTAWNWQQLTAFFWAGICFFCVIYTYFRIPETRNRSFAELDLLFAHKVSARKFSAADPDVFASAEARQAAMTIAGGEDKEESSHIEKSGRVC